MTHHSRQRRKGVRPHRTLWTPEAVNLIDAYQAQHHIPSFSAAAETLVRLGLEQSPTEAIGPVVTSAVRIAIHRELERLIRLQIYTAVEAGIAQRFAAAAVRDIGRLKQDDPERYDRIKAAAIADTRRRLARDNIGRVIEHLYTELAGSADEREDASSDQIVRTDGDREGEFRVGREDRHEDGEGCAAGGEVLHLS